MKKDKNWLDVVKSSLKVLEDDISFLRDFDVSLPSEISNFLERMNSRYASAIEKIVREDESGYSDLEDILVSVNETRLQQYQKAAKSMLQMTRKELKSAFWFRDQFSLSQRIDDIEKRILEIDSSLTSKEPTEIEKSINLYRDQISALGGIQNSFQWERHRSRLGISLKVLFWGIPILIGIWISGKFDNSSIFAFIGIIFLFAALSYLFVGSKRFEEVITKNKLKFIISLVILLVITFLWLFYDLVSSYFEITFNEFAAIEVIIGGIFWGTLLIFVMDIPERLVKRKFEATISPVDKNFYPGDKIILSYSLENKGSNVITEISVQIYAPGLDVLSYGSQELYKSMGGKTTENGELKLLEVPKETVAGEYAVKLEWSFYVGSKWYTKTNKIRVNVVS